MKGFFSTSDVKKPSRILSNPMCGKCGLYKTCRTPKMGVGGSGEIPIYWFAEAGGATEDKRGTQLCGKSGSFLRRKVLRIADIDIEDCWKDNALRCRPPGNRDPKPEEIICCRPNMVRSVKELRPKIIIPMGTHAVTSILGTVWKKELGGISKWRGWTIPDHTYNAWICPTLHPAYVIRDTTPKVAEVIFEQDLKQALSLLDTPLPKNDITPDCVTILKHPNEIRDYLKELLRHPDAFPFAAFDYETTGLKPHRKGHDIVSCSICTEWDRAYAFPMLEEIRGVFKKFLRSMDIWKVAANLKFEDIWSRVILGTPVARWAFDTMIASHVLDNREGITSLKFQAYRRFGVSDYDSHIRPFLESKIKGGNEFNEIHKIPLRDLLLYNGYDSLNEYRLAILQQEEIQPQWI